MIEKQARAGVDTNIYVSALLTPTGTASRAVRRAFEGVVLHSVDTLAELRDVLSRPKFIALRANPAVQELIDAILDRSVCVDIAETVSDCRDRKDNIRLRPTDGHHQTRRHGEHQRHAEG